MSSQHIVNNTNSIGKLENALRALSDTLVTRIAALEGGGGGDGLVLPIGSMIWYFGTGIKGDLSTREIEISIVNGDDIDLEGYYVANGHVDTPNIISKLIRGKISSGDLLGSDDAVIVEHNHNGSSGNDGEHTHNIDFSATGSGHLRSGGTGGTYVVPAAGEHNHVITVDNEGVAGTDKNIPATISAIPIIRMI